MKRRILLALRALLSLVVALGSCHAWAWGAQGHRISGGIADALLDARTRIAVHQLLGQSIESASTWMDEERKSLGPRLGKWHYTNTAVCGAPVVACKNGDCALEQIEPLARVVADTNAPQANRIQSLLMLIHMIEDMHQPLHAADNHDRGGNDIEVIYAGARKPLERKLHEFWDTELVKMDLRGNSERGYIEEAASRAQRLRVALNAETFREWNLESNRLAREAVYGGLTGWTCGDSLRGPYTLSASYVARGRQVVAAQLVRAGERLAAVLNAALGR